MSETEAGEVREVRVKFAVLDLPLPLAEQLLEALRSKYPYQVGQELNQLVIGPEAVKRRRANGHRES